MPGTYRYPHRNWCYYLRLVGNRIKHNIWRGSHCNSGFYYNIFCYRHYGWMYWYCFVYSSYQSEQYFGEYAYTDYLQRLISSVERQRSNYLRVVAFGNFEQSNGCKCYSYSPFSNNIYGN